MAFSIQTFAKTTGEKELSKSVEEKSKQRIQIWCEVRGIYTKFTGENGVVNHVCAMGIQAEICYYVLCAEWHNVQTIQTSVPVGIDIEEGTEFIAIPTPEGMEITYLNGFSYTVVNNTLTITPN